MEKSEAIGQFQGLFIDDLKEGGASIEGLSWEVPNPDISGFTSLFKAIFKLTMINLENLGSVLQGYRSAGPRIVNHTSTMVDIVSVHIDFLSQKVEILFELL